MQRTEILKRLSRRMFIRNTAIATTGTVLLSSISACNSDFKPEGDFGFFEGVASFDPTQTQVILWTRYTPPSNQTNPTIIVDVAATDSFDNVLVSQMVQIDTQNDNTIKVDVSGLQSNTRYFYRFRNEEAKATSPTGMTKTLPAVGEVTSVKMAVASCANFQAGLFNVYGAMADSDADVVVHLGDYIYEYAVGEYGTNSDTKALGREHLPTGEIISLDDYRQRYRQYRSDTQLKELHRTKPFICVWDDHEITNDTYKDGAENHQPDEGSFADRKANALQAWHEYLPARTNSNELIYRQFDFGGIAELLMLDTRIVGRDKQLSYADFFTSEGFNQASFVPAWTDTSRTILGETQRNWLMGALSSSTAKWQVIGSQVLMGKYQIPAELLVLTAQFASGGASIELFQQYQQLLTELTTIKGRILQGDPTVTAAERARVETLLPYNLDAWDGYPAEREAIYAAAKGKKLITLAGDTHNAWHSKLTDIKGDKVGAEFATASVTSPGLEQIFGTDPQVIVPFQQANQLLINDLEYVDASQRGYLEVTFTESSADAEWRFIDTISTPSTSSTVAHSASEM